MKLYIYRTAMVNGAHCYDVLVPIEDLPPELPTPNFEIIRDGQTFVDFTRASLPVSHFQRQPGWERYEAWLEHSSKAQAVMLEVTKAVFPELSHLLHWPCLWVDNLDIEPSSALYIVDMPEVNL